MRRYNNLTIGFAAIPLIMRITLARNARVALESNPIKTP
jgi:hypothetical protein